MFLFVSTVCAPPGFSQVTNVAAKVASALKAYGPVPVTRIDQIPRKETHCHSDYSGGETHGRIVCETQTVYDPKSSTANQILEASSIRIVTAGDLVFGSMTKHELPDHVQVDSNLATNCSAEVASQTFTVSEAFQRTASISFSQSVSHTTTYGMNVGVKISDVFSLGGNVSFGENSTSGTVTATGSSNTVTVTRTGTQSLPPKTFLLIQLKVWPVQYTIPFKTTVTVDADLTPNDKGYQHLSQIVPIEKRSFPISGKIEADDASQGVLEFDDVAINLHLL
jgi:hypothetical protein